VTGVHLGQPAWQQQVGDDDAMKVDESGNEPPPAQSSRPQQPPDVTPGPLGRLKQTLHRLYVEAGGPSYDRIVWLINGDDSLSGAPSRDTIARIMRTDGFAGKQEDVLAIATVLAREGHVRGVPDLVHNLWIRSRTGTSPGQLVADVSDPFEFQVHRAIEGASPNPGLPLLPRYVRRDHDRHLDELTAKAIAGQSVIATLVGESSTGKTRSCWELLQRLPTGWRIWHPLVPDLPEALLAEISDVEPNTVIWLNEAQAYLSPTRDHLGEKVAAQLRDLLRSRERSPVLLLATMWPSYWHTLTRRSETSSNEDLLHTQARELLIGSYVPVPSAFNNDDFAAAIEAAEADPRLRLAIQNAEQGQITQYLAGGPALVERYETASEPVSRALLQAAIDARRLGFGSGLPLALLAAAAPHYLSDVEWGRCPSDWLKQALEYASESCRGAPGPLTQLRPRPGELAHVGSHYRLADYLEQYGREQRRKNAPPVGFWVAVVDHAEERDLIALGWTAQSRGFLRTAFNLYMATATRGTGRVGFRLAAAMLWSSDRVDDAVTWYGRAGDLGSVEAFEFAAHALASHGRDQEAITWYQRSAEAGNVSAWASGGQVLKREGRLAEALSWFEKGADEGDRKAFGLGIDLWSAVGAVPHGPMWMIEHCEIDPQFILWLKARARAGVAGAFSALAGLYLALNEIKYAISWYKRSTCAHGLINESDLDQETIDTTILEEDRSSAPEMAEESPFALNKTKALEILMVHDLITGPPSLPQFDDFDVSEYLDGPRAGGSAAMTFAAPGGDEEAEDPAMELWFIGQLLEETEEVDEAIIWYERAGRAGNEAGREKAAELLMAAGRLEDAFAWQRQAVDAGDFFARGRTSALLISSGRIAEALNWWCDPVNQSDSLTSSPGLLAQDLQAAGQVSEALEWCERRAADRSEAKALVLGAELLSLEDRIEDASQWWTRAAAAGVPYAERRFARLLAQKSRLDDALLAYDRAAVTGDSVAVEYAARMLMDVGREAEAMAWCVDHISVGGAAALVTLGDDLAESGDFAGALVWYQPAAEAGSVDAAWGCAWVLLQLARSGEAFDWCQRAASAGAPSVLRDGALVLESISRDDEAFQWYRAAVEMGDAESLASAGRLFMRTGRGQEGIGWFQALAESGNVAAFRWTAMMYENSGSIDDALNWFALAETHGDLYASNMAADLLRKAGRIDEALAYYVAKAGTGDELALKNAAQILIRKDRIDEALWLYRRAADAGRRGTLAEAVQALHEAGRDQRAAQLSEFGWRLDGLEEEPWAASDSGG
jgi:hypothetical protein